MFGGSSNESKYFDHRSELWGRMRDWLNGGMLPDHRELRKDLCAPEKEWHGRDSKEKLESKDRMKKRGFKSPNFGDALALTFHAAVARRDQLTARKSRPKRYREAKSTVFG